MAETGGSVLQQECQSGSRVSQTLRCVFDRRDAAVPDVCVEREWIRSNDQITIIPREMTSNSFGASPAARPRSFQGARLILTHLRVFARCPRAKAVAARARGARRRTAAAVGASVVAIVLQRARSRLNSPASGLHVTFTTSAGRAPQRRDAANRTRRIEPAAARGALDLGSAVSRNEELQRGRGGLDRGPEKCDRDRASTTRRLKNIEPRLTPRAPGLGRFGRLRDAINLVSHVKRPPRCYCRDGRHGRRPRLVAPCQ